MCQNFTTQLWQVLGGNLLLVLCSIFYLIWWCITFKPGAGSTPFGTMCIGIAFVLGMAGIVLSVMGLNAHQMEMPARNIPGWIIVVCGLVIYFVLLFLTGILLHRQVTSELLIITGWAVLELCIVNFLYGAGRFPLGITVFLLVLIILAAIASMICYLLYYNLPAYPGYVDGMIPLITVAASMMVVNLILMLK